METGWVTIAQHQHYILSWTWGEGTRYGRTACGLLVAFSSYDRAPDAPVCIPCRALHPEDAPEPSPAWRQP